MATTYTTTFGTSNMRGTSRQTRTNPTRTSKTHGSNLRQNSLISNPPPSIQGINEPHGFYPAIQHFTDAITALPRDYRRHTSLLKEVDAKAWQPEENLQVLLQECVADKPSMGLPTMPLSANASTTNLGEDAQASAANSVAGVPPDALSQVSNHSAGSLPSTRRHLFASLRHNLVQIMVTMDEKNHVINNANEELSRHIRRLDNVWPHVADEVSEEARLGSLKHWALTDINPTKKANAPTSRKEAAASLGLPHENEAAQRSESRREAMAAKTKQRMDRVAAMEGPDETKTSKKKAPKENQRRDVDSASELPGLGITAKGKKGAKALGSAAMEKSLSAAMGGRAMSREPSQQDGSKKRKAPAGGATVARKRVNAAQDSPKLVSSPLAGTFGKEAYKRSPALGTARPVSARARQNSTQVEGSRSKPSSTHRNGGAASATASEIKSVAAATGKSVSEVKQSLKENTSARRDRLLEDDGTLNGESTTRGGLLLERRASKTRLADPNDESSAANSPRPSLAALNVDRSSSRGGRAGNKTSGTPTLGTFADAGADSSNGNGKDGSNRNAKRPARQRVKYDGLHDSLSPKGLPPKRLHKKNGSIVSLQQTTAATSASVSRIKEDVGSTSASAIDALMSATASGTPTPVDEAPRSRGRSAGDDVDQMDVDEDEREDTSMERGRASSTRGGASRGSVVASRAGVSAAAASVATAPAPEEELDEEEVDEEEEEGEEEEKYCYCQTGSYGEMVACDNDACPREWFHLECIGLKSVPKSAKWYCDECKAAGFGGGLGGSSSGGGGGGGGAGGNGVVVSAGGGGGSGKGRTNGNGGGR